MPAPVLRWRMLEHSVRFSEVLGSSPSPHSSTWITDPGVGSSLSLLPRPYLLTLLPSRTSAVKPLSQALLPGEPRGRHLAIHVSVERRAVALSFSLPEVPNAVQGKVLEAVLASKAVLVLEGVLASFL